MGDQLISDLEKIMYKVSLRDPITVVSKEAIRRYKGVPKWMKTYRMCLNAYIHNDTHTTNFLCTTQA